MSSMQQANMTFAGQNLGAKKPERVKRVLWICMGLMIVISTVLGMGMYALGPVLLTAYNSDPMVIAQGMIYVRSKYPYHFALGANEVCVGQLRGIGCSLPSMLISVVCICVLRVVWVLWIFPRWNTLECLYLSYPISWVLSTAGQMICYFAVRKRYLNKETAA